MMRKILLDTNTLIQCIPPRSEYRPIWDSCFDGSCWLCVTTEILNEYTEILQRLTNKRIADYITKAIIDNPYTLLVNVYYDFHLIAQDPDDNKFVNCAISAGARYIVTEDAHFNCLKHINYPKVDIISLDDYLAILANPDQ